VAWLEPPLLIVHNFVGKHKHRHATCCADFGSLNLGDNCIQNYPFFNGAEGHPFVGLSGQREGFVKGQIAALQFNA
jgi:hypothetical protein